MEKFTLVPVQEEESFLVDLCTILGAIALGGLLGWALITIIDWIDGVDKKEEKYLDKDNGKGPKSNGCVQNVTKLVIMKDSEFSKFYNERKEDIVEEATFDGNVYLPKTDTRKKKVTSKKSAKKKAAAKA